MNLTRRSFLKLTGATLLAPVLIGSLPEVAAAISEKTAPTPIQEGIAKTYLNPLFDINPIVCVLYELHSSFGGYFNDATTRGQLRYQVEDYLRHLQCNRMLYDFKVICDDSNNPVSVLENNDLVLDVALDAVPYSGKYYLRFSYEQIREGDDPRDMLETPLKLEDVIFVTNSLEVAEQKAQKAKFIMAYVLASSATEEHCRLVHSILCKFWNDRNYMATLSPAIASEHVVGRNAVLNYKELKAIPLRSLHLTHAERDLVHAASINALHYYPSAGLGPVIFGNYAWSNGQPLMGITVESMRSRGVIFSDEG